MKTARTTVSAALFALLGLASGSGHASEVKDARADCLYLDPTYQTPGVPLTPEEIRARRDQELARVLNAPSDCGPRGGGNGAGDGASGNGDSSSGNGAGAGIGAGTDGNAETELADALLEIPVASTDVRGDEPLEAIRAPNPEPTPVSEVEVETEQSETEDPVEDVADTQPEDRPPQDSADNNGRVPADIPPARNDDRLAAQIRAAAMAEEDPETRERLWDEYRRIKGIRKPG